MIHQEFKQHKIDIHGGGVDLRFPHHENEAAQNCALHNHDLANYWVHNAMINLDGVKMSKSLGNVHLAKDLIEVLGSNVVRWLLVSNHYRQLINITDETIEQSKTEINRIETALKQTGYSIWDGNEMRTRDERWNILINKSIPILGLGEVAATIQSHIWNNEEKSNAVKEWKFDLRKLKNEFLKTDKVDYFD